MPSVSCKQGILPETNTKITIQRAIFQLQGNLDQEIHSKVVFLFLSRSHNLYVCNVIVKRNDRLYIKPPCMLQSPGKNSNSPPGTREVTYIKYNVQDNMY